MTKGVNWKIKDALFSKGCFKTKFLGRSKQTGAVALRLLP